MGRSPEEVGFASGILLKKDRGKLHAGIFTLKIPENIEKIKAF
jgi:hypothetical protein